MLKALIIETHRRVDIVTGNIDFRSKKFVLCNNGHCICVENDFKYTKIIHKTIDITIMQLLLKKAEKIVEKDRCGTFLDNSPPTIHLLTETGEIIQACYYSDDLFRYYNEVLDAINRGCPKKSQISLYF